GCARCAASCVVRIGWMPTTSWLLRVNRWAHRSCGSRSSLAGSDCDSHEHTLHTVDHLRKRHWARTRRPRCVVNGNGIALECGRTHLSGCGWWLKFIAKPTRCVNQPNLQPFQCARNVHWRRCLRRLIWDLVWLKIDHNWLPAQPICSCFKDHRMVE